MEVLAKVGTNFCIYGDGKKAKNWITVMFPDSDTGIPTPTSVGLCNYHAQGVNPGDSVDKPARPWANDDPGFATYWQNRKRSFRMHHKCQEEPCPICESRMAPNLHRDMRDRTNAGGSYDPDFDRHLEGPSYEEYDLNRDSVQPTAPIYDSYGPNMPFASWKEAAAEGMFDINVMPEGLEEGHTAWIYNPIDNTLHVKPNGHHYGILTHLADYGTDEWKNLLKAYNNRKTSGDDLVFGDIQNGKGSWSGPIDEAVLQYLDTHYGADYMKE